MTKRKLLTGLVVAGLFAGGFSAAVLPASAEQQEVTFTFADGTQTTMMVDVPPGTPLNQIKVPGAAQPVVGAVEKALPQTQNQSSTTTTSASPPPPQPTPPPSGPATAGKPVLAPGGGHAQQTTGRTKRKTQLQTQPTGRKAKHHAAPPPIPANAPVSPPSPANPTFSYSVPGPTQPGVPNFFIDKFRVPLFLLPIYQAAGNEYGVPWQVLAAINEIETDYGRDLSVSSAGAEGWMQFLPSTWARYGVDATGKGRKDPYNPADAIFAAARYLKAAGAEKNLRSAIFAYNHANWYVDSVLLRAQLIGGMPDALLSSLTGLTQGHFPVAAPARYADDPAKAQASGNKGSPYLAEGVHIYAQSGSPVIAVQDSTVTAIGSSPTLGKFIRLRDSYGNEYTYGHLQSIVSTYPVPKPFLQARSPVTRELGLNQSQTTQEAAPAPGSSDQAPAPTQPATAGQQPAASAAPAVTATSAGAAPAPSPVPGPSNTPTPAPAPAPTPVVTLKKERLFASPSRPGALTAGGRKQIASLPPAQETVDQPVTSDLSSYFTQAFGLRKSDMVLRPLRKGSTVIAGTILGRIGGTAPGVAPHVLFDIRPGGPKSPLIDAKPILDGWKLLEATSIYKAAGENPFLGPKAKIPTVGQVFLMSKEALQQLVLRDPNVTIYEAGRRDIADGRVDRRVLADLEYLSVSGFKPTVSELVSGQGAGSGSTGAAGPQPGAPAGTGAPPGAPAGTTGPQGAGPPPSVVSPATVTEHASGNAITIIKINDIPVSGHQTAGSIADVAIRHLLTLQGFYKPYEIISKLSYPGTDNTISLPDHADKIEVAFEPLFTTDPQLAKQVNNQLKPDQWIKLIDRLRQIPNPAVPLKPTSASIPATGNGG